MLKLNTVAASFQPVCRQAGLSADRQACLPTGRLAAYSHYQFITEIKVKNFLCEYVYKIYSKTSFGVSNGVKRSSTNSL